MKILIISQYWAPENGVPQRRWSWLTEILEGKGHSVTVIAPPPHYNRSLSISEWWKSGSFRTRAEAENGDGRYMIVRTGFLPAGKSLTQRVLNQAAVATAALWVVFRKPGVLRDFQPDLVIGSVPALPTAVVSYIAGKRFGVPYVIDLRDAWPDLIQVSDRWNSSLGGKSFREKILSKGPLQMLGFLTRKAIDFSLVKASGIIVTSSRLGEALKGKRSGSRGTGAQRIALVRNVFPLEVLGYQDASGVCDKKSLNVLYAGTLGRAQNLTNAVEAVKLAVDAGYDVKLRLVGAGAAKSELARVSEGIRSHIEISSKIAPEDLVDHYIWADTALVHLTDWEALGQAVPSKTYELMSLRKHISAVVAGETAELIEELEAGHVVKPERPESLAQLWIRLIEEPSLLHVSSKGKEWVSRQREKVAPRELLSLIDFLGR